MLKMLIVDDEKIIRDGLSKSIDWNSYGIEICGVKTDGYEALEFCRNVLMPDIIVTDIKMSKMSGLDFVEELDDAKENSKIILISGFDDFEFFKRALHNNVFEYLLKPVMPKDITDAVVRARDIILENREVELKRTKYLDRIDKNIDIIRSRFLSELACGAVRFDEESAEVFSLLGINIKQRDGFFVMVISLSGLGSMEHYMIFTEFQNDNRFYVFSGFEGGFGIVCPDEGQLYESAAAEIQKRVLNLYSCDVSIGVSSRLEDIGRLNQGWEEAGTALDYKDITGGNQIIYYEKTDTSAIRLEKNEQNIERSLIDAIDRLDKPAVGEIFGNFFDENPGITVSDAARLMLSTVIGIFGYLMKIDEIPDKLLGDWQSISGRIKSFDDAGELIDYCTALFSGLVDKIIESKSSNSSPVVDSITEYIMENLDKPFSLKKISQFVFLSPNYVSTLFRRETGKKLKDYVVELRIEKAKQLLKDQNMKIYEVSEAVGYSDSRYFGNLFKKLVGMSPAEYRKMVNNRK